MPSISAVGNISPVSTTRSRPSHSTTVMFLPISPSPPSGRIRTGEVNSGETAGGGAALRGAARDEEAVQLERGANLRPLLLGGRDHRQAHVALDDAEHLQPRLHRNR